MRAAGSQLVVDMIESALRQGGLALFDEGFQIDSSLNWVFGENIEGEVDAVVPLWSGGGHAVFMQPGFVFWTGLADEERIDGNLGIAYRAGLTKDVIGGASIFYDRDFKQGHSRVSFGADVQSGFLHGAANYYQPLSDEEDGREGFVEEALRGMDFRLAVQRDVMRVSGNLGYWRFEGDDTVEADWKISYGLDAGIRVFPGVFIEGGWERHDEDVSLDSRWNAGLAFRFSLPDFKGASYGDGSMSSNLYQIVDREKRILYEERVAGPSVSIALGEGQNEVVEESGTSGTDVMANIQVQLDRVLGEDVILNLVGGGTATYGANNDWRISVDGTDCASVTGTGCQVTITAGENISDAIVVSVSEDGAGEPTETIILSIEIASAGDSNLRLGNSRLFLTIEDQPFPTVSFVRDGSENIEEGSTESLQVQLSGDLEEEVTLNLVGSGTATYGADNDWSLSVGGTDCASVTGTGCQVTIAAGDDVSTEAEISINQDGLGESSETIILSIEIASAGETGLMSNGDPLVITILPSLPTVTISIPTDLGASSTLVEGSFSSINITLSEAVTEDVTLNLVGSGVATYGTSSGDWHISIGGVDCASVMGTSCQVTITAGATRPASSISVDANTDSSTESPETFTISVEIGSGSESLVQLGSRSSERFTIAAN